MFLVYIQAKIGPKEDSSHKTRLKWCLCQVHSIWDISVPNPGKNGAYGELLPQIVSSMLSMGCLPYPSRLKSCLRGAPPTNPCPVRSLQDVSLTHPGWNSAYRISTHQRMPSMHSTGCFSYTSRLKWCQQEHLQNHAQFSLNRMLLLHIQSQMVPMENSHKPMPTKITTKCFSYTSRLKSCLRGTRSHKPILSTLCTGCFSDTSGLKWCIHGTTPTNPYSVRSVQDVSLTHPGWNGTCMELLPQTHTQSALYRRFLLHIRAEMVCA